MAIRRRSLRNARNLRSRRRYGGVGSKSSNKKKLKKSKTHQKTRDISQGPSSQFLALRDHSDYDNVIRKEYKALAELVQKHINDSKLLKTEFYKLKSQSVFLK